ncbi:hypothetical protein ACKAMS_26565 [Rhodococcus sp. 5A-K4]|uniref:hypothetical protein n=1 Tax=Rhodococcus sp. 5A-K4 TaxID=3384442 RepID=UPI001368B450|nr:hypothetical protein [Rhodococcus erythropolis]
MGAPFADDRDPESGPDSTEQAKEVLAVRRELALVNARLKRIERDLASTRPLIEAVRGLKVWDYTPYTVNPGQDWVAVDRTAAEELLAALAHIDHWTPWHTRLEPRPPS